MPDEDLIGLVDRMLGPMQGDMVELLGDDEFVESLRRGAGPFIDPDAPVTFHGGEGVVFEGFRGFDGLIAGWREWLGSFASYRFVVEHVLQVDERVVVLVRQSGRTLRGDAEVQSPPSAVVFALRDRRMVRADFYMDRAQAAQAEGLTLP